MISYKALNHLPTPPYYPNFPKSKETLWFMW